MGANNAVVVILPGVVVAVGALVVFLVDMVSLDKYALFCVVLFAGVGVATIMLSHAYLARRKAARGEFYGLLMLVITGMTGMVVSTDIVAFFVSFELMSLPTYVLAGYLWRDARSGEASIKYFVTGAFCLLYTS